MPNIHEGAAIILEATGNAEGEWFTLPKGAKYRALAASIEGDGALVANVVFQGRLAGIGPVNIATVALNDTDADADGDSSEIPWPEVRAIVTDASGTITSIKAAIGV